MQSYEKGKEAKRECKEKQGSAIKDVAQRFALGHISSVVYIFLLIQFVLNHFVSALFQRSLYFVFITNYY
ncbi:MAG: hypothetical protein ACK45I_01590, partial [Bacteroidota bacterium]